MHNQLPLFLFGFPRSGTTLLRSILGTHSKINLSNELDILPQMILQGISIYRTHSNEQRLRFFDQLKPAKQQNIIAQSENFKNSFFKNRECLTVEDILRSCNKESRYFGDKSISGILFSEAYLQIFPDARYIYISRDPRATILSKLTKDERKRQDRVIDEKEIIGNLSNDSCLLRAASLSLRWNLYQEIRSIFIANMTNTNFLNVDFELLVSKPESVIKDCCKWLELDYEENMLNEKTRSEDQALSSTSGARAHPLLGQSIDSRRSASHLEVPHLMNAIIENITGHNLQINGYHRLDIDEDVRTEANSWLMRNHTKIAQSHESFCKRFTRPTYNFNVLQDSSH